MQKQKHVLYTPETKSGFAELSLHNYITNARFVILQYFEKSANFKFLTKTLEFAIKETVAHFGIKEGVKLLLRYINEILLRRKLDPWKECEEQVLLITKLIKNFALKNWILTHPDFKNSFRDSLQLYVDTNVFETEAKEDIEGYIEEFK